MLFRSIQFSLYKYSTNGHVCIFLELEEIYSITHGEFAVGAIGVTKNHVVLETKRNTHPLWWMSGETLWILNPNKTITCCYTDFLSHSMDDAIISVLTVQCSWSVKMSNAAFWRPFHTHTHSVRHLLEQHIQQGNKQKLAKLQNGKSPGVSIINQIGNNKQ